MSALDKFHDQAMDAAFHAEMEKRQGNQIRAQELFAQALDLELRAIAEMSEPIEPTFSVLHRSAGWLALDCNNPRLAEQLASKALAGNPQPKIAEELRDLLEQVNFYRHLLLKGVTLEDTEVQLSLSGQGVGFGFVSQVDLLDRIDTSSKVLRRIAERRSKRPFREKGRVGKSIEDYQLYVSTPRAASFAVTLRVGRPTEQLSLDVLDNRPSVVLDEFLDLLELMGQSKVSELQERISDPAYLRNFIALSKKIAPDGERIKQVGFTALREGKERIVEVRTPASVLPSFSDFEIPKHKDSKPKHIKINGLLCFADATRDKNNKIKIVDDQGTSHIVIVPEGMMDDIVRPMWNSQVIVEGTQTEKQIVLQDVTPDESD